MKIIKLILVPFVLFSLSITLSNCKKYPDGPVVSLRSKTERVSNSWKIENYKVNGDDLTSIVTDYHETFYKNGNYSFSWGILSGYGNWNFENNKKEIKLSGSESQTSRRLFILKLEEKSFWYYYMEDNDKHEVHLAEN